MAFQAVNEGGNGDYLPEEARCRRWHSRRDLAG